MTQQQRMDATTTKTTSVRVRVGIVGGGAAGVIAAKTLREAGHSVVVFEKAAQLGGVWKYDEATHTDASMYKSLHTNLPTSVMQLDDFSFPPGLRSFVSHADVLDYIQNYARHFNVTEVARFNSTVVAVSKLPNADDAASGAWVIDVQSRDRGAYSERVDKVLVCNGHFAVPSYATIPGLDNFIGETLHSHDYRTTAPFKDKRLLLLGCGPSGQDISLELAKSGGAREVTVSFELPTDVEVLPFEKRILKPPVDRILADGSVIFKDGTSQPPPDVIMFCTGYLYVVKSLAPRGLLYPELPMPSGELDAHVCADLEAATAAGSAIAPLYKQFFSIEEPDVAFVGLPFKNLPFLSFELQSKWAARVYAGAESLPSKQQLYASFLDQVRSLPFPVRKLHQLGTELQAQYFKELASYSNTEINQHVQAMFSDAGFIRRAYPFHYREAEYTQDKDGKWTRRLTLTDPTGQPTEELVHAFE